MEFFDHLQNSNELLFGIGLQSYDSNLSAAVSIMFGKLLKEINLLHINRYLLKFDIVTAKINIFF